MLTLREIGERTALARDVKSFWGQVLGGLEDKTFGFPFVIPYSVFDDDGDSVPTHSGSVIGARQCLLEGFSRCSKRPCHGTGTNRPQDWR